MKYPVRILSADLLIADIIVVRDNNPEATALAQRYRLLPGGKITLDKAQYSDFQVLAGPTAIIAPGGSSANMLTTLGKLLGKDVEIGFFGIAGEGKYGAMIRRSLIDARIALYPETLSPQLLPQCGVSFVIVCKDGQRTIATWPGNARALLTPEMITNDTVQKSDALLLQGSLWHKLDTAFPDRLLELSRKYGKELWLTLPTQGALSVAERAHFQHILQQAALLFGNDGELARLYGMPAEEALAHLQKNIGPGLAFITSGHSGATIVTAHVVEHVPSAPIAPDAIVNTLGAGDTAFAGFAAGYLKGLPHHASAQLAMQLAVEKLRINAPRLANPVMTNFL